MTLKDLKVPLAEKNNIRKINLIKIVSYKEVGVLFMLEYIRLGEVRLDLSG